MFLPRTRTASRPAWVTAREVASASTRIGRLPHRLPTRPASSAIEIPTFGSFKSTAFNGTHTRSIHVTPSLSRFHFLLSHAVQGKPPDPSPGQFPAVDDKRNPLPEHLQPAAPQPIKAKQIGWPRGTEIGEWRESILGGVEAGEDAVMVTDINSDPAKGVAIGVADGVGSWSLNGVDPALFSQALMYHASAAVDKAPSASDSLADPVNILSQAYKKVMEELGVLAGSSTATILTMDGETGHLRSANLGDSGFIVLREGAGREDQAEGDASSPSAGQDLAEGRGAQGKRPLAGALYRSAPQQYYFNAPYQLSKYPQAVWDKWKKENKGKAPNLDSDPQLANRWECSLKHGDIVIVASDGAWDNVWGKEWVTLVQFLREKHVEAFAAHKKQQAELPASERDSDINEPWLEEKTLVEVIAYNALQFTLLCQFSEKKRSPFEAESEKTRQRWPGGKVDDVAIVVALVVEE